MLRISIFQYFRISGFLNIVVEELFCRDMLDWEVIKTVLVSCYDDVGSGRCGREILYSVFKIDAFLSERLFNNRGVNG